LAEAEKLVATAATDPALIDHARHHAEQVLDEFFAGKGWEVRVRWE
jgi:hypothetical protein